MPLLSHKLVFIETTLLCVTMRERAATIYYITFWYSFCHYKVQFLWCTFETHFDMGTRHFQKVAPRMKLFLSLYSFIRHIANIGMWKHVFSRVVIKRKIFHLYRTCVVRVAVLLHCCCSCSTRHALALFESHSFRLSRTRVARVWHSCCKIDLILFMNTFLIFLKPSIIL